MTTYDDVNAEARADWHAERPDASPGDQEPNEILARYESRGWRCLSCDERNAGDPLEVACAACGWRCGA